MNKEITEKFTDIVASKLHYYENINKLNLATATMAEVSELSNGWVNRYSKDYIFHSRVEGMVGELLQCLQEHMDIKDSALRASRIPHYHCEDCWYSCPKSENGCCDENVGKECNCGADAHNDRIEKAIAAWNSRCNRPTQMHSCDIRGCAVCDPCEGL